VLICEHEELTLAAHETLVRRAEADAGFAKRLHEAAERSLAARRRYVARPVASARIERRLQAQAANAVEERIARALEGATTRAASAG
jgi:hypothetical protein